MEQEIPINKRSRAGRPRMNPKEARGNRIVSFVTDSELADLECIANRQGISMSATVHRILSGFLSDARQSQQALNNVEEIGEPHVGR